MNLKELREGKGLSQKDVYESVGVARSTYGDWERGVAEPSLNDMKKLAEFFEVDLNKLCGVESNLPAMVVEEKKTPKIFHQGKSLYNFTGKVEELEESIREDLEDIKHSFFQIGYKLTIVNNNEIYKRLGYETIIDYAEDKFGFGKTTTYNMLRVYELCSDWKEPLKISSGFKKYNYSQLVEMTASHWASMDLSNYIEKDDTVADIKKFIRIWNKNYSKNGCSPKGANLKEVLARYDEQEKEKTEQPLDVAPGQLLINLDDSDACEFVQGGGPSFSSEEESKEVSPEEIFLQEERSDFVKMFDEEVTQSHQFKNNVERENFIRDPENYKDVVLDNDELGLIVRKLKFKNGAILYRSEFATYKEWCKTTVQEVRYHLVHPECERKPQEGACCTDYSLKKFTLDGTAPGYVVKYMTMYKDEI